MEEVQEQQRGEPISDLGIWEQACVGDGDVSGRETVGTSINRNEKFAQDFPIFSTKFFKYTPPALGVKVEVLVVTD